MMCSECPTIADCKRAFGKYWSVKSDSGRGCLYPFAYDQVAAPPPPKPKFRPPVKRRKEEQCVLPLR